ncbi:hypothetical protein [Fortiea contorta]|uniref:hypothetical protein n=1 Tax=Fortiea contorta TaxID=1892405 RepID=UPI0003449EA9|nr:hypothetical protein [Fortiea contorta]
MPNRHHPNYLRYLKARLWNLGRPSFWGTAIFLSVVGMGIREYWLNPDIFTPKPDNEVVTSKSQDAALSPEDQAIAADIDHLAVLLSDSERASLAIIASNSQKNSQDKNNKILFPDVLGKQRPLAHDAKPNSTLGLLNGVATPTVQNPFVLQADNLLQIGTNYGIHQLSGTPSSITGAEQTGTLTTTPTQQIGLLTRTPNTQTATNQSTNQNLSLFPTLTTSPTKTIGNSTPTEATLTSPTLPTVPVSRTLNPVTTYNQPSLTVPSVTPPDVSQNSIIPTQSSNYTEQQPQATPQDSPKPRPTPNPYGGIEINGYKYP